MGRRRGRRGPCGLRGRARLRAPRKKDASPHARARDHRAHELQSGGRRPRERTGRPRDRRPRGRDGTRRGSDGHPVQGPQRLARNRRARPPLPVRQGALRHRDGTGPRRSAEPLRGGRHGRGLPGARRAPRRPDPRGRRVSRVPRGGRDDRDVPARPHPRGRRRAGSRPLERAAGAVPVGRAPRARAPSRADEDRHSAARSRRDRGRREDDARPGRRAADRLFVPVAARDLSPAEAGRLLAHAHGRGRPRPHPEEPSALPALLRSDRRPRASLLPFHRGQGRALFGQAPPPDLRRAGRALDGLALSQRPFDVSAGGNPEINRKDDFRPRAGRVPPAGICRRIRHGFPRAAGRLTRDARPPGPLPRGTDQRHVRIRGSRRPGARRGRKCRPHGGGRGPAPAREARGLHRRDAGRPRHARPRGAVPAPDVTGRAPPPPRRRHGVRAPHGEGARPRTRDGGRARGPSSRPKPGSRAHARAWAPRASVRIAPRRSASRSGAST